MAICKFSDIQIRNIIPTRTFVNIVTHVSLIFLLSGVFTQVLACKKVMKEV